MLVGFLPQDECNFSAWRFLNFKKNFNLFFTFKFTIITLISSASDSNIVKKLSSITFSIYLSLFGYHFRNIFAYTLQLEEIYKKAHQAIRADPTHKKIQKTGVTKKRWNAKKLTNEQRKAKLAEHKTAFLAKIKSETDV